MAGLEGGSRRHGEAKPGCMAAVGVGQPERLSHKDRGPHFGEAEGGQRSPEGGGRCRPTREWEKETRRGAKSLGSAGGRANGGERGVIQKEEGVVGASLGG